jgi:hypothetical protein
MNNTQVTSGRSVPSARLPRPRPAAQPASLPRALELRELLESHLQALRTLQDEHRQMLEHSLRTLDASAAAVSRDLRAICSARAPWIAALSESRALLYVALRELIVDAEAETTLAMPQHPTV